MTFLKTQNFTRVLKNLANLSFAISLLFIIGFMIGIGTIIEQDQNLTFYQTNYPIDKPLFGFLSWEFITKLGLDHIYTATWFLAIICLFASSLIACTFTTQLPSLKKFKLWNFFTTPSQIEKLNTKSTIRRTLANHLLYQIYTSNYHIFRQEKKNYAYIGLLGRLGPIVVHISILLLLIGTSLSSLNNYNIQELVPRGEVFHLQNAVRSGPFANVEQKLALRVNDFWITYTEQSKTNQFYSDISFLNANGNEIKRKTIFVNEPFQYSNLTIYQTDWDIVGLKISVNDSPNIQIPLKKITKGGKKIWLGSVPLNLNSNKNLTVLLNDLTSTIYLYDEKGTFITEVAIGQDINLDLKNKINVTNFLTATGLQIKEDPGLSLVYFSFFLIIISVYISFFSYSQIWGLENSYNFLLSGKSNRAILNFQEDFKNLVKKI